MSTTVCTIKPRGTPGIIEDPIVPVFTISHLVGKFGDGHVPVVESMTMIGVMPCPAHLAEAFLTFISQDTTQYTQDEVDTVTNVITEIHQRHYRESR